MSMRLNKQFKFMETKILWVFLAKIHSNLMIIMRITVIIENTKYP